VDTRGKSLSKSLCGCVRLKGKKWKKQQAQKKDEKGGKERMLKT
jgi:hypothetical protein